MGDARVPSGSDRRRYERIISSRIRAASAAAWARNVGIQLTWLVIVIAGAAIPLVEVLDGWSWVSPVLGFVIVIAAGVERIFGRTTEAAVALDLLRRQLARERRQLLSRADEYAVTEDPFGLYTRRAEQHLSAYDQSMVDYRREMLRNPT